LTDVSLLQFQTITQQMPHRLPIGCKEKYLHSAKVIQDQSFQDLEVTSQEGLRNDGITRMQQISNLSSNLNEIEMETHQHEPEVSHGSVQMDSSSGHDFGFLEGHAFWNIFGQNRDMTEEEALGNRNEYSLFLEQSMLEVSEEEMFRSQEGPHISSESYNE
jgi:hypothetical protein